MWRGELVAGIRISAVEVGLRQPVLGGRSRPRASTGFDGSRGRLPGASGGGLLAFEAAWAAPQRVNRARPRRVGSGQLWLTTRLNDSGSSLAEAAVRRSTVEVPGLAHPV